MSTRTIRREIRDGQGRLLRTEYTTETEVERIPLVGDGVTKYSCIRCGNWTTWPHTCADCAHA